MRKFKCSICGFVYDEAEGIPGKGIAAGTKWEDIPADFTCPTCSAPKVAFKEVEAEGVEAQTVVTDDVHDDAELREVTADELAVLCVNLAKGCEKQRLLEEMEAFNKLADYYRAKITVPQGKTLADVAQKLDEDLTKGIVAANEKAKTAKDRGALRSLVWSEKVSLMLKSLLDRFAKEGDAMLANTKIYVCEICGFVYLGDTPPEVCPVCKVPNFKITAVERR